MSAGELNKLWDLIPQCEKSENDDKFRLFIWKITIHVLRNLSFRNIDIRYQ